MSNSVSKQQLRQFGFLIGIVFPIFLGFILPLIAAHPFRQWTLWIGIPSLLLAFFAPRALLYPYKTWMKLGHLLGFINSHIILGLVFIVVLQPIALIMRIFGYDPLRKKKKNDSSYREIRKVATTDLKRIF